MIDSRDAPTKPLVGIDRPVLRETESLEVTPRGYYRASAD
jgi:hypothetical protein